jgi:hypothetical protein
MARSTHLLLPSEAPSSPSTRQRRCAFVVTQTGDGRWIACDRARSIKRIFPTQRAAVLYALFDAVPGRKNACAVVVPSKDLPAR